MLTGYYETPLVLISILVAIVASYSALSLAGRVTESRGRAVLAWTVGGAVAMGSGIWAMHFVRMLAFRLPIPIAFDPRVTMFSLLLARGARRRACVTRTPAAWRRPTAARTAGTPSAAAPARAHAGLPSAPRPQPRGAPP